MPRQRCAVPWALRWPLCDRLPTNRRFSMKNLLTLMIVASASLLIGADAATYVAHDKVAEALAKGGPLGSTKEYTVSGSHRDKAGQVEVHEKETDILYIVEGEATFVTGGTMVGGKLARPGQLTG